MVNMFYKDDIISHNISEQKEKTSALSILGPG